MRNQIELAEPDYISDVKAIILCRTERSGKRCLDQAAEARLRLFSGRIAVAGVSSAESWSLNLSTSTCSSFLRAVGIRSSSPSLQEWGDGPVM